MNSQMLIESNVDVNDNLTAPLCKFGDEYCNLQVAVNKDGEEQLLITLPTNGKSYDSGAVEDNPTTTYDMRSIIESIQELNRRTATFSCNVSFEAALKAYDVSDPSNQNFACDTHKDGLPAATNGSDHVPPLTEKNKYRILLCFNHEPVTNLHEDTGLVINLTDTDKSDVDLSNNEDIRGYISNYNANNDDKIIYLEAYPNIHTYDESARTVVVKVLTQSYFEDDNRLWKYEYRTWRSEDNAERSSYSSRIDYLKLSARYNYSLTSTKFIGNAYNAPMTSLIYTLTFTDDNPAKLPNNSTHVAEYIYQFAPIEVSENPTEITDNTGTYGLYNIDIYTSNLKTIDLSYHDTSRVEFMTGMFYYNTTVTDINIPDTFNTSIVKDFSWMFSSARSLRRLILPASFDTSNAITLYGSFSDTSALSTIVFDTDFNTKKALMLKNMFRSCGVRGLLTLPSGFTAESAKGSGITGLFAHMPNCDSIAFPSAFEVGPDVTSYYAIFRYSNFRYLTIPSKFIPENFTNDYSPEFTYVFEGNSLLTQLFLPDNFKLSQFSNKDLCLSGLLSLSMISIGDATNLSTLTTVNNAPGLVLDNSNWKRLSSSSNIYTKNIKNFSINCNLTKQPDADKFSATLDISHYPIRPGCEITLMIYTKPIASGPPPDSITIQDNTTEYTTSVNLSDGDKQRPELNIAVTISEDYSTMIIESDAVTDNYGESWYIDWIYNIKVDYP